MPWVNYPKQQKAHKRGEKETTDRVETSIGVICDRNIAPREMRMQTFSVGVTRMKRIENEYIGGQLRLR